MEQVSLPTGRLRRPILRLQSDDRLARLAADGGDSAFEILVRRHRPALLRSCSRILPGPQAEDAVQQALLGAHQALLRNGAPDRFEPWLHRIAVNAALKELGRSPEELPLDDERTDGVEQPPEGHERRERLRETVEAIGALPARQRRALLLRELEGRSHTEIARSLGLTKGAVRQLIHRARNSVRSAASALTPYGLLMRIDATDGHARLAELVGGGAVSALAGKAAVTALLAGGIAGGIALAPEEKRGKAEAAGVPREKASTPSSGSASSIASRREEGEDDEADRRGRGRGSERDDDEAEARDSSGPRSGDDDEDHSGPGGGGGSGSSGQGGGGGESSGSGSSGSGSSGSGSSGSDSSSDGDSSGSGSSGSGSLASEPGEVEEEPGH
jgi:RNA polymerase sigma factor (sigma-70 family)